MRLAADSEAGDVQITTDEPAAALIGAGGLHQRRAALARALADHAHQTGRAVGAIALPAEVTLLALPRRQAHRAVALLVATATCGMLDERIATGACSTGARREG